jgi:hypothetical protein
MDLFVFYEKRSFLVLVGVVEARYFCTDSSVRTSQKTRPSYLLTAEKS